LQKPFTIPDLVRAIERTRKYLIIKEKLSQSVAKFNTSQDIFQNEFEFPIIGSSQAIEHVKDLMKKVANTPDTCVMITGESGVGKENVARGIHKLSSRHKELFGAVNSSAITDSLFESEFFGYKKGAFTGAYENKPGWFEVCNGGTLFLDEITDLSLGNQAKLLRTLEDKTITRVGTSKTIELDIRIISATNQAIDQMVENKQFRSDLYHRLNTFCIHIPPLRERKEDIPSLFDFFLNKLKNKLKKNIKGYDPMIIPHLQAYSYPGNIRELKNIIERALIIGETDYLQLHDIAPKAKTEAKQPKTISLDLESIEKETILKAIDLSGGKRNKTAQLLNITPQSLDRRLEKHGIKIKT
jgi:transcriptional regulator with PAS, ATPase and Fis domain